MSFGVEIVESSAEVEPGSTLTVAVEVTNRSDQPERYELSVEGLDSTWAAIPVPDFTVEPHSTRTEKFFLKPPRESDSVAGSYPYVVQVRSLETGDNQTAQGLLELKPYHHLSLDISPKKVGIGGFRKQADLELTVINLGNSEHTVQLFASDQEDNVAFEFEHEQVQVGPGQQKTVSLTASTSKSSLLSSTRLDPYSITARSVEQPSVSAVSQGQVEQRAVLSPAMFTGGLLIIALLAAWFFSLPKPPEIVSLSLSESEVTVNTPVTIRWRTRHADTVDLKIGDRVLEQQSPNGEYNYLPDTSGQVDISIVAYGGDKKNAGLPTILMVNEPTRAPDAKILNFDIQPREVRLGASVMVSYSLNESTTKATLLPANIPLNQRSGNIQVKAEIPGDIEYKIVAENADGKTVEKSIKLKVVDASLASIETFAASPMTVEEGGGQVVITWQVERALRVTLQIGDAEPVNVDPLGASMDTFISEDTEIKLRAFDSNGKDTVQTITVKVRQPDPVPPPGGPDTTRPPTGASNVPPR